MKLPRDITGAQIIRLLAKFGYTVTRQTGSHIRLTTEIGGRHSITVPNHKPMRVGTLAAILSEVANHHKISRDELSQQIF